MGMTQVKAVLLNFLTIKVYYIIILKKQILTLQYRLIEISTKFLTFRSPSF